MPFNVYNTVQDTHNSHRLTVFLCYCRFQSNYKYQRFVWRSWQELTPTLFWDFTQRRMVLSYGRFWTIYQSHLQGLSSPRLGQAVQGLDCLPMKMGRIRSPETSVRKYISMLHKTPKERRTHLHRGGSLKSRRSWGYRASKLYLIFWKFRALRVFNDTLISNRSRDRRVTISWWAILFYCSPKARVY